MLKASGSGGPAVGILRQAYSLILSYSRSACPAPQLDATHDRSGGSRTDASDQTAERLLSSQGTSSSSSAGSTEAEGSSHSSRLDVAATIPKKHHNSLLLCSKKTEKW